LHSGLTQKDGSRLRQGQAFATFHLSQGGDGSQLAEFTRQHTAAPRSGDFFDFGVLYAAARTAVFDAAAGMGYASAPAGSPR